MKADASTGAPAIAIRRAQRKDLDAVAAIERESFSLPWSRASFANLLVSAEVEFLVACDGGDGSAGAGAEDEGGRGGGGGRVVGYAVLYVVGEQSELANLAVARGGRRRGVGRLLLRDVVERARARSASAMFLEVRESNLAAQGLYASLEFHAIGRRRRYYSRPIEDALVLRLELGAPAAAGPVGPTG